MIIDNKLLLTGLCIFTTTLFFMTAGRIVLGPVIVKKPTTHYFTAQK